MHASLLIGSQSIFDPAAARNVRNPANLNEVVGRFAVADEKAVADAVEAAAGAFPSWSGLTADERAVLMTEAADQLESQLDQLAELLTMEHGKPVAESMHDVAGAPRILRYYADLAARFDEPIRTDDELGRLVRVRRPMGPMAVIVPWNAPVYLAFLMIAPALLAGNTIVVKPASNAPLAISAVLETLVSVLPPGVVNSVPGPGAETGSALARHPAIRGIRFTGSTETGKHLMREAAETVKNLGLELGGNDPALVLEGATVSDQMVREFVEGVYASTGQICYNIKRIYVHESRYDDFVTQFTQAVSELVIGDGRDPAVTMGPLNNRAQHHFVEQLIADAERGGATVDRLGKRTGVDWEQGWFSDAAVVTNIAPGEELVTCEQFGPVVPVLPFSTEAEAVALANDSEFGLAASIWDDDVDHAFDVAGRIEAGTVFVNVHRVGASDVSMEFGGFKQSGIGRGHGWVAVEESSELQVLAHRPGWVEATRSD